MTMLDFRFQSQKWILKKGKERLKHQYKLSYYKIVDYIVVFKGSFGRSRISCQWGNSDVSDVLPVHALVLLVTDSSDVPTDRQHSSREWKAGTPLSLNHWRRPSSTGNWSDCKVNWEVKKTATLITKHTNSNFLQLSSLFKPLRSLSLIDFVSCTLSIWEQHEIWQTIVLIHFN